MIGSDHLLPLPASEATNRTQPQNAPPIERPTRVLFATGSTSPPHSSLQRSLALADLFGAELHILSVVPQTTPRQRWAAAMQFADVATALERFIGAARTSSAWCAAALAERFVEDRLTVRLGHFAKAVQAYALEIDASILVVAASELPGNKLLALARATARPVLVARPSTGEQVVLAATNLADSDAPVLQEAALFARYLSAPVIAVHNVRQHKLGGSRRRNNRALHLQRAAQALPALTRAVVAGAQDAAEAVVNEARAWDADVVVVGTHVHARWGRIVHGSVGARIIDRAPGSVLITPL